MTQVAIQEERQKKILEMLVANGKVHVHALALLFNVTPETIRRDLSRMASQKLLKKFHGGALSYHYDNNLNSRLKFEHHFQQRVKFASDEKRMIANKAVSLISPGDTVFVDFGSTTLEFARALVKLDEITVICNAPLFADILQDNTSIDVILTGGKFYANQFECLGSVTLENIARFFADYAIIGAGAIHQDTGVMDQDLEEACVAKKMIERSRSHIVLADSTKFDQFACAQVMNWKEIDCIVTNDNPDVLNKFPQRQRDKIIIATNKIISGK